MIQAHIHRGYQAVMKDGPTGTTFWLVLEKGMRMLTGLLFSAFFIKNLGPELNGNYASGLAFAYIIYPVFTLGLNELMIFEYSHHDKRGEVFGTTLGMKLGAGLVIMGIYAAFLFTQPAFSQSDPIWYLYASLWSQFLMFWLQSLEGFDYYLQTKGNVRALIIIRVVCMAVFTAAKIWLCEPGGGPYDWLIMAMVPIEVLVGYLIALPFSPLMRTLLNEISFNGQLEKSLRRRVMLQLPTILTVNTFVRVDVLIIKYWLGNDILAGIYSAAVRYSEPWFMVPYILANAFSAKFYSLFKTDRNAANALWARVAGLELILLSGIVVFTLMLAPAIQWFFGAKYENLVWLLSLHSLTIVFSGAGSFAWPWLLAAGYKSEVIKRNLFGLVWLPVISWLLWPLIGLYSVILALITGYAVMNVFSNRLKADQHELYHILTGSWKYVSPQTIKDTLRQR